MASQLTYWPAVISEGADESREDAVQVWQDGMGLQLAYQLSHAVAGRLPASVVVCPGLRLIVLQHLCTATMACIALAQMLQ